MFLLSKPLMKNTLMKNNPLLTLGWLLLLSHGISFFKYEKGSLFSVLQEEVKSYLSLINIAHISKLTEYSDNIFSH